ncbi:MAG TPA: hypothetical protein VMM59_02675 [Thermohalobaculum sp.]|nr:hypothetical protein [Thermohalobaculum sp.]
MTLDMKKLWEPPALEAIDMRDTAQKTGDNEANNCGVAASQTPSCSGVPLS